MAANPDGPSAIHRMPPSIASRLPGAGGARPAFSERNSTRLRDLSHGRDIIYGRGFNTHGFILLSAAGSENRNGSRLA
jgi:hypothetical protein